MRWFLLLYLVCGLALSACTPAARSGSAPAPPQTQPLPPSSSGYASWYGPGFAGKLTANGEVFDPSQLTAAHKTLPFGTQVRVTNLNNGRSVVVRINDRGPFVGGRVIDLSRRAAEMIDMIGSGTAPVRLELLNVSGSAPGTLRTAVDRNLQSYSVISAHHPLGALLLLSSASGGPPLMVRVVGISAPQGVDMLISRDLYDLLGEGIKVISQGQSA